MCQHHGAFAPGARAASVANALLGSRPSGQWAATRPGPGSGAEGPAVGRSLAPEGPGLCLSARPARKGRHVASVPGRATQRPPALPESERTPQPLDLCPVARASRLRDGRSRARPGRGVVASGRPGVMASGRRGVVASRRPGRPRLMAPGGSPPWSPSCHLRCPCWSRHVKATFAPGNVAVAAGLRVAQSAEDERGSQTLCLPGRRAVPEGRGPPLPRVS